jgi:hypothetical protein
VHQATLVLLVLREREETGVNQDRGVCRGRSGHKVRQEKQVTTETLGPPELPAFPDQQDHLEIPETQEQQGSQVRLVLQEREERGEREEILVMMDSLELQVPLEHQESQVIKAQMDQRAQMVILDRRELKAPEEKLVYLAHEDQSGLPEQTDHQEKEENEDLLEPRVTAAQRVSGVQGVLVDKMEHLVIEESLESGERRERQGREAQLVLLV